MLAGWVWDNMKGVSWVGMGENATILNILYTPVTDAGGGGAYPGDSDTETIIGSIDWQIDNGKEC